MDSLEGRLRRHLRRAGLAEIPLPLVYASLGLAVILVCIAVWRWWPRDAALPLLSGQDTQTQVEPGRAVGSESSDPAGEIAEGGQSTPDASSEVVVHVAGSVKRPGVYRLLSGQRVADAIEAAGGSRSGAALEAVNLARVVTDGEQVLVPDKKSVKDSAEAASAVVAGAAGATAGAASGGAQAPGALVDVNTADAALLDTLPGVGPSTATRIIADREANGPFATVDDLGRVSGIGPKRLEQLRSLVRVQ